MLSIIGCIFIIILVIYLINNTIKERFTINTCTAQCVNPYMAYEKQDTSRRMFDSLTYDFEYLNFYT